MDDIVMSNNNIAPLHERVELVPQFQTLWCWAACVQMILRMQDDAAATDVSLSDQQCRIVSQALTTSTCCSPETVAQCNRALNISSIGPFWNSTGFEVVYSAYSLSEAELCQEIDAGRPVQVGWKYALRGHVVLVTGYVRADTELRVIVQNPWPPGLGETAVMSYAQLATAQGEGTWKWSWKGIDKMVDKGLKLTSNETASEKLRENIVDFLSALPVASIGGGGAVDYAYAIPRVVLNEEILSAPERKSGDVFHETGDYFLTILEAQSPVGYAVARPENIVDIEDGSLRADSWSVSSVHLARELAEKFTSVIAKINTSYPGSSHLKLASAPSYQTRFVCFKHFEIEYAMPLEIHIELKNIIDEGKIILLRTMIDSLTLVRPLGVVDSEQELKI